MNFNLHNYNLEVFQKAATHCRFWEFFKERHYNIIDIIKNLTHYFKFFLIFFIFFVQDIRVELIRPHRTTDFESVVSTNFTNPA